MNAAWSNNFTYDYFVCILRAVKEKFNLRLLGDGLAAESAQSQLFLRHDVDVSINRALIMAELEAENDIRATYMFMPHSRLYDVHRDREQLRRFVHLKHEVALHFDVDNQKRMQHPTVSDMLIDIDADCQIISGITGKPVRSVSFHRPMPQCLKGEFAVAGLTNAYSAVLMESYISDSKGEWRNGEPLPYVRTAIKPVLQVLIHPIWWGAQHMTSRDRLEEFYLEATADLSSAARTIFDVNLAFTIPAIRRSNYTEALWGK